jgi:DNA-binding beta-propeller fold protein YncE
MRIPIALVLSLALMAGGLTACFGGGSAGGADANPQAEQPGVLRTIAVWAGSPNPGGGSGYRDGTSSAARFEFPQQVAVANDGSVYVVEVHEGGRLRRIDASGQVSTVFHAASKGIEVEADGRSIRLGFPRGVVAAPSGGVFVVLERASRTQEGLLTRNGSWAVLHVSPGAPLRFVALPPSEEAAVDARAPATALAIDKQGTLYVSTHCTIWRLAAAVPGSTGPRVVQKLYETGSASPPSECAGYSEDAILGLAVDANERLLFTVGGGHVKRLEPDLRVTSLRRTSPWPICGMAVDPQGELLVAGTEILQRLDNAGGESTVAGRLGRTGYVNASAQAARFSYLCGVAIDGHGRIVLADVYNHVIRRIEPDGSVITLAGPPSKSGYVDGVGEAARFSSRFKIGPGSGRHILVADRENNALREVDLGQRMSTLAGGPERTGPGFPPPPDGPIASAYFNALDGALRADDGSVWIADSTYMRRWGTDGIIRTVSTSPGSKALALDRGGDVIVAQSYTWNGPRPISPERYLERYSTRNPQAAPERLNLVLSASQEPPHGSHVNGVCALPDGTFAFTLANAVLRRAADGTAHLLAGALAESGTQDGPGTAARFASPTGLACDASGGIYVADYGNHTVRYIDAQRNVRTVLGTPGQPGHRVDALPGELSNPHSLVLVPGGLIVATGQGLVRAGF